jgi:hypothetical protein
MSAPEEIQNETQTEQPMDVVAAVTQLRAMVCGLGAGLILVSLALSGFVFKQTRDVKAASTNRERQIAQLQSVQKPTMSLLNELAKYSMGKPELIALFTKHGLQVGPPNAAAPQR